MSEHRPETSPEHNCRPIGKDELPNFPTLLGFTDDWSPSDLTLEAPNGALRLTVTKRYSSAGCRSFVLERGTHSIGAVARHHGEWQDKIILNFLGSGRPVIWSPAEPPDGIYELFLTITPTDYDTLRGFEWEHVLDFGYAWDKSVKAVEDVLSECSAATEPDALGKLTVKLRAMGAGYLVPETPAVAGAWGPRIKAVYTQLAGHSRKRDGNTGSHRPTGYAFTVTNAKTIAISYVFGGSVASAEYIKPEEIAMAATGAAAAALDYGVGDLVVWNVQPGTLRAGEQALELSEKKICANPDGDSRSEMDSDNPAIIPILYFDGGMVVWIDGDRTWVKADFREPPDDDDDDDAKAAPAAPKWRSDGAERLDPDDGIGYVQIKSARLKKKPS